MGDASSEAYMHDLRRCAKRVEEIRELCKQMGCTDEQTQNHIDTHNNLFWTQCTAPAKISGVKATTHIFDELFTPRKQDS